MHTPQPQVFIFVNDCSRPGWFIESLGDRNCLVLESCSRWPSNSLRLQSEEPAEVKTVQVDGISVWCVRIGVCQDANEEPSGAYDNGNSQIRFCREFEKLRATPIDLIELSIGLVLEVIGIKLVEGMIELELFYHEEILRDRCFFHFRSHAPTHFFGNRGHSLGHLTSFRLSLGRVIASYELINGKGCEGNFGLREDMKHIELQGIGALLSNWEHLEPT